MKTFLLFLATYFITVSAAEAQFCTDSLVGGGGFGSDNAASAAMDGAQNLYVAGSFDSSASFSGFQFSGNAFRYGVFLNKYYASRKPMIFKDLIRLKSNTALPPLVAVSGNRVYIFCRTSGDSLLVNGAYYGPKNTSSNFFVLLQTDLSGNVIWQKLFEYKDPLHTTVGQGLAVDGSGNIFIGGTFTDTMSVGTGFVLLGTPGNNFPQSFVVKIGSTGNVIWARQSGSSAGSWSYLRHLSLAPDGRVIAGGHFHGTMSFGSQSGGATAANSISHVPFLAAFDSSGTFAWLATASTAAASQSISLAAASDGAGNTYTTGFFRDSVDFGGAMLYAASQDMFLAKYASNGALVWAKKKGGHVNAITEGGTGITVNHAGRLVVTGVFTDSTYFGATKYTAVGGQDFFIAEYDNAGSLLRANTYGSTGLDEGDAPLVHPNDSVVVTGYFGGPSLTINGLALQNKASGKSDVFSYDRCTQPVMSVPGTRASPAELHAFPNPADDIVTVALPQLSPSELTVYDIRSRMILRRQYAAGIKNVQLNTANWSPGAYFLLVRQDGVIYRHVLAKE